MDGIPVEKGWSLLGARGRRSVRRRNWGSRDTPLSMCSIGLRTLSEHRSRTDTPLSMCSRTRRGGRTGSDYAAIYCNASSISHVFGGKTALREMNEYYREQPVVRPATTSSLERTLTHTSIDVFDVFRDSSYPQVVEGMDRRACVEGRNRPFPKRIRSFSATGPLLSSNTSIHDSDDDVLRRRPHQNTSIEGCLCLRECR